MYGWYAVRFDRSRVLVHHRPRHLPKVKTICSSFLSGCTYCAVMEGKVSQDMSQRVKTRRARGDRMGGLTQDGGVVRIRALSNGDGIVSRNDLSMHFLEVLVDPGTIGIVLVSWLQIVAFFRNGSIFVGCRLADKVDNI